MFRRFRSLLALLPMLCLSAGATAKEPDKATLEAVDAIFEDWRLDAHVPGLIYGIVSDGRLVAVRGIGVEDIDTGKPVSEHSLFRIASMSKAFTAMAILKLRDEGKLSLDAPAEAYVPELAGWTYPTRDSRKIRVRDLIHHSAGLVTDDPWGDRQQPLSEADFTALLRQGVPFARSPGIAMEYSNLGYAILGRIITNVAGRPYQDYIRDTILTPLGMRSTGHDVYAVAQDRRALGYRWEDGRWVREPDMADGTFGAMGGVQTNAVDYERWVRFILSAWPASDAPDQGPVSRATVREIFEGSNHVSGTYRSDRVADTPCRTANAYGMGWRVIDDCELGRVLMHSGGYPGYGSNVVLLPDKGVGVFAFTNRTYSGPSMPVMKAAQRLGRSGDFPDRGVPVSDGVAAAYVAALKIWEASDVTAAADALAMNMLPDRSAAHRNADIAGVKAEVGACTTVALPTPLSALEARFVWACAHGRVGGHMTLAPTPDARLQSLDFAVVRP